MKRPRSPTRPDTSGRRSRRLSGTRKREASGLTAMEAEKEGEDPYTERHGITSLPADIFALINVKRVVE